MDYRAKIYSLSARFQHAITPGLPYSQTVFEQRLAEFARNAKRWLDLGCGHRMLPEWRGDAERAITREVEFLVGLDSDLQALGRHRSITQLCAGDITKLPFRDASFDLITANMVIEHLADPATQFAEVARVLAPGGVFVFHTPNARSYVITLARLLPDGVKRLLARVTEGRAAVDVYPTHYRANDAASIETIAARGGFAKADIEFVASTPALSVFPPLVIPELLWIRQLQRRPGLAKYRHTLICALRRSA
jgi:ubiquinone/menaquinone biosynthesis C-methylase UbiE